MNLRDLRKAGVPLAAIETADPALTIKNSSACLNGKADTTPIMEWDIIRGLVGCNKAGQEAALVIAPDGPIQSGNPSECLSLLAKAAPEGSVIFFHNAHKFLSNESVLQGIWNLRDAFEGRGATLILLGPSFVLGDELKHDIIIISEELPDQESIEKIIDSICADAGLPKQEPEPKSKQADALLGLSGFAAKQCLALSITKDGIDVPQMWERKRKMVEQTPGLSVWRGGERFDQIGGYDNVKGFMRSVITGRNAPRGVLLFEEIEKYMAGSNSDSSGVSQDFMASILNFMQDNNVVGCIFIGIGGSGKSAIGKCVGNEATIPTMNVDLGAMKGSLVGQSEGRLRQALKVALAVSQGRLLALATCNSYGNLPPELKRRFTLGTFYFDLPTEAEQKPIWDIYRKRYELQDDVSEFDYTGWTGAEIRNCCDIAWRLRRSLAEASKFIVPVAKSASETIETLRKQASGKFISASHSGTYQYTQSEAPKPGRRFGGQ